MSRMLLDALMVFTLASPALAQHAQTVPADARPWRELGPAPITTGPYTGRVSAIVCDPLDQNRVFIGGADGGVWRTLDGGGSWKALTDELSTTAIGALALDPSDANVLFAGTGEANFANHSRYGLGVYRTLDGGDTWEHFGQATFGGRCISALAVDPRDGNHVFAAVTRAGGFPELAAARGHAGALGDLGLFRSFDRGATWTRLPGLPNLSVTSLALDPTDPDRLFCGVGHIFGDTQNGVWRSLDGGESWTELTNGLPTGLLGRVTVALAPSDPQRLYALLTNPSDANGGGATMRGIFRSDDGGASWNAQPNPNIQSTYGWYLSVISVRPTSADTVFLGGLSLVRSTGGGSAWSTVTPPHVDLHALAWDAGGRLWAGDDGGVQRSGNLGSVWTSRNAGLGLTQFYAGVSSHPSDDEFLFGGLQDNGSNKRTAGAWTQVLGGDGGWTQLVPSAPNTLFAEFQGSGNLYKATDGGTSFSWSGSGIDASDRNCFLPPYIVDPFDANRMYYATQRLWRSTNGGTSWSVRSGDLTAGSGAVRALALSPAAADILWAATNDGRVLHSSDGGANFALRLSGVPGGPRVTRELCPHPTQPATLYLAVSQFGTDQVRRTLDAGLTWTALDADLPDVPVHTLAVLPGTPDELFAGTDRGVWHSVDGGAHWRRFGTKLPNTPVIDLLLEPAKNRLIAATQGRGAWSIPLAPARQDF